MKARLGLLFAWALLASANVIAADTSPPATDAETDAIIRKLEQSGALDAAVERAINRYVQRKEQARQADEARAQTELKERAKQARPVDPKQDHVRGNPAAEVSLIEYSDFECPFCKSFHATPKALLDRYKGRVNWVLRNDPLPFHDPAAHKEALAAECVARLRGNDAYWQYADALFANTKSNGGGLPPEKSVERLAESAGIKSAPLTQCMDDAQTIKRVEEDMADATAVGVTGTPTTVVRNNRTGFAEPIVGALSGEALSQSIERALAAKP